MSLELHIGLTFTVLSELTTWFLYKETDSYHRFGIYITKSWLYKKDRHNGKWRYDKCNNVCNDTNTLAADKLMISLLNFDDK